MSVLFCHAAGFCGEVWRPVINELSALARQSPGAPELAISAIDLPGHGHAGAEAPALPLTPKPFCDAVLRAAVDSARASGSDASGSSRSSGSSLVGVGHSLGGTSPRRNPDPNPSPNPSPNPDPAPTSNPKPNQPQPQP